MTVVIRRMMTNGPGKEKREESKKDGSKGFSGTRGRGESRKRGLSRNMVEAGQEQVGAGQEGEESSKDGDQACGRMGARFSGVGRVEDEMAREEMRKRHKTRRGGRGSDGVKGCRSIGLDVYWFSCSVWRRRSRVMLEIIGMTGERGVNDMGELDTDSIREMGVIRRKGCICI
jgi:hypothetical protein